MGADSMESLGYEQAVALVGQMRDALLPATLQPAYVRADATREPSLEPIHLAYRSQGECWMHSLHVSKVPGTSWQDASSPYGYGGPLSSSDDPEFLRDAWAAYAHWMRQHRVAVEYVRFHPVLRNERLYGGHVQPNREVVCVDLGKGDITSGYAPRLRNTLKKAARARLRYVETPLGAQADAFAEYYRHAMREMGADTFYMFDDGYFEALAATGLARLGVCTKVDDRTWLAACLMLDGRGLREYHLAATVEDGRQYGASSFALHEAALAARERGLSRLYLGGGTDRSPDNSLLFFKGAFSGERLAYSTGSAVFDDSGYEELKGRFPREWASHPERPIFYRKV